MKEVKIYIAIRENNREYAVLGVAEKRELLLEFTEKDIQKYIKNLYGRNNLEIEKDEDCCTLSILDKERKETLCSWKIYKIKHIVEGEEEENVECQEVKEVKE